MSDPPRLHIMGSGETALVARVHRRPARLGHRPCLP
jgi:hypothetical protein